MTVSVGDGVSLTLVQPSVYRGTSAPTANVKVGDLWMDTSTNPPVLKQCENLSPVTWVSVDSGGGGGGDGFNLLVVNGGAATLSTTLTLSNSNNVSFGLAGGVITATATFAGGGGGGIAIAAGTQTATTNTVAFANSNGISFGMSNSSQITASYTVPSTAGLLSNINVSAGTTSNNLSAFTLSNSNNVSFGLNGSVITGSVSFAQSTAPAAIVGSNATYTSGSVTFAGSGAVTVRSTTGQQIVIDAPAQTVQTQNLVSVQGSTGNISFSNSNGITFGFNASTITASHNGLTSQSNQAFSAPGGSSAFQTLNFVNSNGVSFTNTNGSLAATVRTDYAASDHSHGNPTLALTNLSGTTASNSNGLTLSLSAAAGGGGVNPVASASNGSFSFTTLNFSNANNVTFGTSAGSIITASVAAPGGGGAVNFSAGTTSNNLQSVVFSNSNGVSFGLNGSTITASAAGGVGGTATLWQPFNEGVNVAGQVGNASLHIVPLPTPVPAAGGSLTVDRLCVPLFITNATNSTGTVTVSHSFGLYTRGTGTQNTRLSLAHSTSTSLAVTFSGTVNNSTYAGIRLLTVPWTTGIDDGRYYVAQWSRTTTGGANASASQMLVSQLNSNFSGVFGEASNRSNQWPLGYGVFSASVTTAMPASIAFSQIDGTASLAARPPSFFMISSTA